MSKLEGLFKILLQSNRLDGFVQEYRFHPTRRWRFDFAFPKQKVAVEVEGGAYTRGRHTRGSGFTADCEKYSHAAAMGWKVLRFTGEQITRKPRDCMGLVRMALND